MMGLEAARKAAKQKRKADMEGGLDSSIVYPKPKGSVAKRLSVEEAEVENEVADAEFDLRAARVRMYGEEVTCKIEACEQRRKELEAQSLRDTKLISYTVKKTNFPYTTQHQSWCCIGQQDATAYPLLPTSRSSVIVKSLMLNC